MTEAPRNPLEAVRDSLGGLPACQVLDEIVDRIRRARDILLAGHRNPDGDSLGSCAALGRALARAGKEVQILLAEEVPDRYRSLFPPGTFRVAKGNDAVRSLPRSDLCILLDTNEPERAGPFREVFFAEGQRRVCIDHHVCRSAPPFDACLVVPEAPATGSLVLALIEGLGLPLTKDIAELLWVAIATDTGWFRFENTGPWALRDAARLAEAGVDVPRLHRLLYEEQSLGWTRVLGSALGGLRSELCGRFAWSVLPASLLEAYGVSLADLDGVVDHLKGIRDVQVVALIVETGRDAYKVSLRARGAAEVESVARRFGGGGHAKAAGCRFSGKLEDLVQALGSALRESLPPC